MKFPLVPAAFVLFAATFAVEARIQFHRPYVHPKLAAGQTAIRKIVILPPDVRFNRIGMKGAEGTGDTPEHISESLYLALATDLAERGVDVLPNPMASAADDQARYAVADFQHRYDTLRVQLARKPALVEERRYSMGDSVSAFLPSHGADALLFVRATGIQATKAKTAAIAIGFGAVSELNGDMAFIDAHTGEVLAWAQFIYHGDASREESTRFVRCTSSAIRDIPFPTPPKK